MSSQQHLTQQPISTSSCDWRQATDEYLEVHMSDSEGTKKAKEAEKSHQEAAKKECSAEACHQKAEGAWLERERKEQEEWERWEQEEWERQEHKEQERWEAEKGQVGELQHEGRGSSMASSRRVAAYSPMTGASMGTVRVAPMPRWAACKGCRQRGEKRKKKCSWVMAEEAEAAARPSRKRARTGSSWGKGQKKGWPDDEEDNDDDKIEEVPVLADPQSQAAYPHLVREMIVAAMERLALAMEVQARVVQAYVRHMTTFPLWPPVVQAGVAPGGVGPVAMGSTVGVERSGLAVSGVAEGSREWDEEDTEGEAEGMQE
ncbi:hypothetical protein EDD16DRAFT_1721434 [Pisolithus croceorrhizus]|nr:hypothetical protein EDD16DRAFT_1721434 [Pisolithus croceorrhizus]